MAILGHASSHRAILAALRAQEVHNDHLGSRVPSHSAEPKSAERQIRALSAVRCQGRVHWLTASRVFAWTAWVGTWQVGGELECHDAAGSGHHCPVTRQGPDEPKEGANP